ncbi:hypothetical protein [Flagellimonas profundi]|uniref:Metallo-beta-lactamase domain-containing protein n=1 Tax=Flagellimonas profundi TaxID=2915620 RepID=A0ABS3FBR4_9FLAO|nr:hypothetical protein [Allomuricauda profundi]MBO0340411.1 hypothetical protein [Allomuricauda profundi]
MNIGKNLSSCSWCVLLCCVLQINGQTQYDVKKVNDHVYIFTELWDANANGNCGVVIGDKEVLLINSMMLSSAPDLEKEIQKITDLPIGFVINSDSDTYNHNANSYFADKGATIISHENIKYSGAYHQLLFKKEISIHIGDEVVTAYHTPSHTLDHVDIYLENSNVLFMGDGFQPHWLTYTGPNGIEGVLSGINKAIALSDDNTIIVPGNTSKEPKYYFGDKDHLLRNREIYVKFNRRVGELFIKGFTTEEIALDEVVNKIVEKLEAYPKFKPYLTYVVEESVEVNFKTKIK